LRHFLVATTKTTDDDLTRTIIWGLSAPTPVDPPAVDWRSGNATSSETSSTLDAVAKVNLRTVLFAESVRTDVRVTSR
jgi:hypothetical protein